MNSLPRPLPRHRPRPRRHALCLLLLAAAPLPGQPPGAQPTAPPPAVTGEQITFTLPQAVERAISFNPDILRGEQAVREALGKARETRAIAWPKLGADANWNRIDPSNFESFDTPQGSVTFGQEETWDLTTRLTQVLYSGGQVRASLKIAELLDDAAVYDYERIVADILLQVTQAFYNVLVARQNVTVREESAALLTEQLRISTHRYEAGSAPRFDVLRAEVELANAQPPLIRARNDLILAKLRLARLLALGRDQPGVETQARRMDVVGSFDLPVEPEDMEEAIDDALALRPEIRALEQQLSIQRQNRTLAAAGTKPSIGAFGQYGWRSGQLFDDVFDGWTVGLQATWNLFDGFLTQGRVEQADAQLQSLIISLDDTRRQIELDARTAWANLQEAIELLQAQQKSVATAEESLRLANVRYQTGQGTQLEVLDAQVALTEARTNQVEAQYSYHSAKAEMLKARGRSVIPYRPFLPFSAPPAPAAPPPPAAP